MTSPGNPYNPFSSHPPTRSSRRRFLGHTGAGMLAAVLPGRAGANGQLASSYSQTIAYGRQAIQQLMSGNQNISTISVALLKSQQIVWQQAFGMASMTNSIPATLQTRYNIGSVSKVLAALVATILQDRGLISLETPMVQYLPAFTMLSPEYKRITVRHLLSHTSGFPGTNGRNAFMLGVPATGYAADTEAALANQHLKHLPGELAVYCNDGFTMIEQIVLAVTGQPYADFVQENLLTPLAMTDSGFLTSVPSVGEYAYPWLNGKQYAQEFVSPLASGGLSTTPTDMMNLARMLIGGGLFRGRRIVSAAGIAEMATDQTTKLLINPSPEWRWGLGWDSVHQLGLAAAGVNAWQKGGNSAFFETQFMVLPDAQMALMVTGNNGFGAEKLAEGILIKALLEQGALAAAPARVSDMAPPVAPAPNVLDAAGIYGNSSVPRQVIVAADGGFTLNKWNGTTWVPDGSAPYQYRSDGWWWSTGQGPLSFRFEVVANTDEEGKPFSYRYLMMRYVTGAGYNHITLPMGQQLSGPQLPALPALDPVWQARMGIIWNLTNQSPDSLPSQFSGPLQATLSEPPWLQGYILLHNNDYDLGAPQYQLLVPLANDRGGMAVKVPVIQGRDLQEISFSSVNGVPTMTIGSWIYTAA
ncbi:MAG TPA: serine hydrolase domain-containing protein [Burkholderiaceae bacterium]|nr:serine hydrolase domain-containing protein [Burkholderiaceae bacterium]